MAYDSSKKEVATTSTNAKSMMAVQKNYIESIGRGLESLLGSIDAYQAVCGYNILNEINIQLAKNGLTHQSPTVDRESINNAIKYAILYRLNTDNREVFVIVRNDKRQKWNPQTKKNEDYWVKTIDYKPQYKGHLKILGSFGKDVRRVYPEWVVREKDEFTYPKMQGIESVPPTWIRKSAEGKVVRVVVPVEYKDGFIDFRIAERESVATNIKAQIKQSLMKASDTLKTQIMELIKDMTLDELLINKTVAEYVNDTYTGLSSEEMIITKLILNATKRVTIDFTKALPTDVGTARSLVEKTYDNADVYKKDDSTINSLTTSETSTPVIPMEMECPVEEEVGEVVEKANDSIKKEAEKNNDLPDDVDWLFDDLEDSK